MDDSTDYLVTDELYPPMPSEADIKNRPALSNTADTYARFLWFRRQSDYFDKEAIATCIFLVLFLYREYTRNIQTGMPTTQQTEPINTAEVTPCPGQYPIFTTPKNRTPRKYMTSDNELLTQKDLKDINNAAIIQMLTIMSFFTVVILAVVGWMITTIRSEPPVLIPYQTSQGSLNSGEPGGYTESKTHSHNLEGILRKRDDKSPKLPSSE